MFKLLEPIGFGTSGEVWRAEMHIHPLVAVKLSIRQVDDDEVRREFYLYNHLIHLPNPSIVKIHCLLEYRKRFGIIMELADCNLFDKLRQYRKDNQLFPLSELVSYIRDAASALDFCHSVRVIHAGINPSDILLFGKNAKIADFGVSHHLNAQNSIVSARSLVKEYCMSPEAREGNVLPQSDQYALAATFAWLRFGHLSFLANESVIDLSNYPERERTVLQKALSLDPYQRYANCMEFVSAIK
jgi:serine/threonine protein kinase